MKKIAFVLVWIVLSVTCFAQETTPDQLAPVEVLVTDFENNSKKGEQVLFEGINTGKLIKGVSDENGKLLVKLPGGDTYLIKLKSVGKAKDYNKITIPALGPGQSYSEMQITIKYELPKVFTLDNVHFETNKSTITKNSYPELNELVEFLTLREEVEIEIAGHTDNVGDDAYNMKLSQERADAVRNFLISKGITQSRVLAKGYGEDYPVDSNNTPEGRQNNRRTEVRIVKGK
ncbi:MAG: OmpA family protein [Bacteroidales bacterium]|nr:OmpA family protein [Bacteroidales bacterium]